MPGIRPVNCVCELDFPRVSWELAVHPDPMTAEFFQQLSNPKFDLIEAHFGHPVPAALRRLYADHVELRRQGFKVVLGGKKHSIPVAGYTPINEDSLEFFPEFEQYLEFASDGGEGLYFIDPTLADPKVLHFEMDGYDLAPCRCTLSQFLAAPHIADDSNDEEY